jgi:hypothetical protein
MIKYLKRKTESDEIVTGKNIKPIFFAYLAFYSFSVLVYLVTSFLSDGLRGLLISIALVILVSIFIGPYLFYRVLFRLPVWIPGGVEYGPQSEKSEWLLYSVLVGLSPSCIFIYYSLR